MSDSEELLKHRFLELANKADSGGYFTFTDFLGLSEQSTFSEISRLIRVRYTTFGGADGAERVMIRFGDEGELGYEMPFPISAVRVRPKDQKFAEKLTHRDYLGSLLALGIERTVLGDIVLTDNATYIFVKEDMAEFVASSLSKVRRTDVVAEIIPDSEVPDSSLYQTELRRITVESERLDAILARVYSLSRSDAQALIHKRLVYVEGRLLESVSYRPKPDERISTRGYGRIIYRGVVGTTRRDRLALSVEVYV